MAFSAIPALVCGGYTGAAVASPTIRHAILPLLSLPPAWFPKGPYVVVAVMSAAAYVVVAVMYAAGFPGLYGYNHAGARAQEGSAEHEQEEMKRRDRIRHKG
jgi:hypothetical protein